MTGATHGTGDDSSTRTLDPAGEVVDAFAGSRELFESLRAFLDGDPASGLSHGDLEVQLDTRGRELIRQLFQDHLTLRTHTELAGPRLQAVGADGVRRGRVEPGHARDLPTVVGTVQVDRLAYRAPGSANLHPADAALNLPTERQSHGIRRLAAVEASRGSFQENQSAIVRATGQRSGSVSSSSSPTAPPSTSRPTTPSVASPTAAPRICWCCRVMARAS